MPTAGRFPMTGRSPTVPSAPLSETPQAIPWGQKPLRTITLCSWGRRRPGTSPHRARCRARSSSRSISLIPSKGRSPPARLIKGSSPKGSPTPLRNISLRLPPPSLDSGGERCGGADGAAAFVQGSTLNSIRGGPLRPAFPMSSCGGGPLSLALADLEEMAVRIAEEGAGLRVPVDRLGQEHDAPSAQQVVGRPAIFDTEDDLGAGLIGMSRRHEGDGRLVRRRLATGDEQQPIPQQLQHDGGAAVLAVHRGVQSPGVPGAALAP